jgi:hypothetical protein
MKDRTYSTWYAVAAATVSHKGICPSVSCRLFEVDRAYICKPETIDVIASPTVIMARCARTPDTLSLFITRLLETFRALWAVQDTKAARTPRGSNVGLSQDAAPIPSAMGTSDNSTGTLGRESRPSNIKVRITVTIGIAHFVV